MTILYVKCWKLLWFLYVLNRQTGLLDPGMLVNIQQPLIREDGTVLLATDSKVMLCLLVDLSVAVQTASQNVCTHLLAAFRDHVESMAFF